MRASVTTYLLVITSNTLDMMKSESESLNRTIGLYSLQLMKSGKIYDLDVYKQGSKAKNRKIMLKNVVCTIINQNWLEKQKP